MFNDFPFYLWSIQTMNRSKLDAAKQQMASQVVAPSQPVVAQGLRAISPDQQDTLPCDLSPIANIYYGHAGEKAHHFEENPAPKAEPARLEMPDGGALQPKLEMPEPSKPKLEMPKHSSEGGASQPQPKLETAKPSGGASQPKPEMAEPAVKLCESGGLAKEETSTKAGLAGALSACPTVEYSGLAPKNLLSVFDQQVDLTRMDQQAWKQELDREAKAKEAEAEEAQAAEGQEEEPKRGRRRKVKDDGRKRGVKRSRAPSRTP